MENMFKKAVILSVAVALITLGLFVDPSAAQVTNVTKRGSLLIYAKVNTFTSPAKVVDTVVTIGNDSASGTWVKCYWMDSTQKAWDFEFKLTGNMPAWFSAKTGEGSVEISEFGDNKTGELKCWAVDIDPVQPPIPQPPITTEIAHKFNYLYGSAVIIQSLPYVNAFEYPAWAFAFNGAGDPPITSPPALTLNGTDQYDACPAYLVYNFFAVGGYADGVTQFGDSTLSLTPCQQDLRQDFNPICTKAKFDVWNEDENKLTGAYQCVKCYFEGILEEIGFKTWADCDLTKLTPNGTCKKSGFGGLKFTKDNLHTDLGRFRVNPLAATDTFAACTSVFKKLDLDGKTVVDVCVAGATGNEYRTPFVGVLLTELTAGGQVRAAGTTGTAAGSFLSNTNLPGGAQYGLSPQIKWDAGEIQQAPVR